MIGDGALTGGVAWEGLNNLGAATRPVIVVLNDNGRSYDPTAGALAAHLEELRVGTPEGRTSLRTWDLPTSVRSMGTTSPTRARFYEKRPRQLGPLLFTQ